MLGLEECVPEILCPLWEPNQNQVWWEESDIDLHQHTNFITLPKLSLFFSPENRELILLYFQTVVVIKLDWHLGDSLVDKGLAIQVWRLKIRPSAPIKKLLRGED